MAHNQYSGITPNNPPPPPPPQQKPVERQPIFDAQTGHQSKTEKKSREKIFGGKQPNITA